MTWSNCMICRVSHRCTPVGELGVYHRFRLWAMGVYLMGDTAGTALSKCQVGVGKGGNGRESCAGDGASGGLQLDQTEVCVF